MTLPAYMSNLRFIQTRPRKLGARAIAGVLASTFIACAPKSESVHLRGQCADVHGGTVCTWARMNGDQVVALGATIPISSIEGAPAEMEMPWPPVPAGTLMLPEVAQRATGLTHMTVYWAAHGHPPGAFQTPHFDFHLYGIAPEETAAIDCTDLTKPASLPAGYAIRDQEFPGLGVLVGICVPRMGMHSLLERQFEATSTFEATMVLGYYHGDLIFAEPMIARDYLLKRQDFTLPMPVLPAVEGVRYPTGFRATYDGATDAYRFEFSGFGG